MTPAKDPPVAPLDLLKLIHPTDGIFTLGTLAPWRNAGTYTDAATALKEALRLDATGTEAVFYLVPELRERPAPKKRGTELEAARCWAAWVDIDSKDVAPPDAEDTTDPEHALARLSMCIKDGRLPPPSAVVNSGGGVHAYWLLAVATEDIRRLKAVNKRIALRAGAAVVAGRTFDLARVLRVPGTWNRKPEYEDPRPCELVYLDRGRRYDLEELAGRLALAPEEREPLSGDPAPAALPAAANKAASVGQHRGNGPVGPVSPEMERRARAYLAAMSPAVSGQGGHRATYTAAVAMVHGFELPPERALAILLADFNPRCEPPWREKDMAHKVQDAATKPHDQPRGWLANGSPPPPDAPPPDEEWLGGVGPQPRSAREETAVEQATGDAPIGSEVWFAREILREHGDDLHYVPPFKSWITWSTREGRWMRDVDGEIVRRAEATAGKLLTRARRLIDQAEATADDEARESAIKNAKKMLGYAVKYHSRQPLRSAIQLAESELPMPLTVDDLDQDPELLVCSNGTVNLRRGALQPSTRADLNTKTTGLPFSPAATAPTFHRFLEQILPDAEVRAYLQRFAGYAATAYTREHLLCLWVGAGANGKSTLADAILGTLGDYGRTVPGILLIADPRGDQLSAERALLHGLRCAVIAESPENRRLAEERVKALTGGDVIQGRRLYEQFFYFKPTHSLILHSNHLPRILGSDEGIWRRIALVEFPVVIEPEDRDPALPEKLRAEASGILAWIVAGARDYLADGLRPPEAVQRSTRSYRTDEDELAEFFDSQLEVVDKAVAAFLPAADLYRIYVGWCDSQRISDKDRIKRRIFTKRTRERGYEYITSPVRGFRNLRSRGVTGDQAGLDFGESAGQEIGAEGREQGWWERD